MQEEATGELDAFAVPFGRHVRAGLIHGARGLWCALGRLESAALREEIDRIPLPQPVYVCGLARAGSTVLLEFLAAHPDVATHRYRDFWTIFTPVWGERAARRPVPSAPVERAHGDGLLVTPDSPEGMEEILWRTFFRDRLEPTRSHVLTAADRRPAFDDFYRDHLRKLLLIRVRTRCVAKNNNLLVRLEYLLDLFPDARFVVPVREPRAHVASLLRQQRRFSAAAAVHPRSVAWLDRAGHFEFGLHRAPLHTGDAERVESVRALWEAGDEVRGWARYWSLLHDHLLDRTAANDALRAAVHLVRYDELCRDPEPTLRGVLDHARLSQPDDLLRRFRHALHEPTYYRPDLTVAEEAILAEETRDTARRLGFGLSAAVEGRE
jgi:hypothetical protein